MGWLWLVGSITLQVSFAEYGLFYKALLQKRPRIESILLTVATPCWSSACLVNTHTYAHTLAGIYVHYSACILIERVNRCVWQCHAHTRNNVALKQMCCKCCIESRCCNCCIVSTCACCICCVVSTSAMDFV